MRTIAEIIKAAGGPEAVARAIGEGDRDSKALSASAVHKWKSIGIPDRHWSVLIELAGTSAEELFEANRAAREAAA